MKGQKRKSTNNQWPKKQKSQLDRPEQCSCRNCLLIYDASEDNKEDTDEIAEEFFNTKIDVNIPRSWSYPQNNPRTNPRPAIVNFIQYNDRRNVFSIIKKLKGSGTLITESLTSFRMGLLTKARKEFELRNVWTLDGRIIYMDESSQKPKVYYK